MNGGCRSFGGGLTGSDGGGGGKDAGGADSDELKLDVFKRDETNSTA